MRPNLDLRSAVAGLRGPPEVASRTLPVARWRSRGPPCTKHRPCAWNRAPNTTQNHTFEWPAATAADPEKKSYIAFALRALSERFGTSEEMQKHISGCRRRQGMLRRGSEVGLRPNLDLRSAVAGLRGPPEVTSRTLPVARWRSRGPPCTKHRHRRADRPPPVGTRERF